jgi:hypothetical protein
LRSKIVENAALKKYSLAAQAAKEYAEGLASFI